LAMAERHLAAHFNSDQHAVFDHFTYVICGDGCLQEGVSAEACSLAGHLGLGKLIVLYDDNNITIDGETSLSFTEDVLQRYAAYGWHTQAVTDVESTLTSLREAIHQAQAVTDKPSIIKVKTHIGFGSPSKQGLETAHGAPLGVDDLAGAKKSFGLPPDQSFYVPEAVQQVFTAAAANGNAKRLAWEAMFGDYAAAHPEKAAEISRRFAQKLPDGILDKLPTNSKDVASRQSSQMVLSAIGPAMHELIGGSADLTPSNLTHYTGVEDFQKDSYEGRYIRFGVREHGMAAVTNGIFAHGGLRPYCATFLIFSGYAIGAIRLAALSKFGVIYVMTHDSIGLGEDGPTHQPIETLETFRAMPNILVFRPADTNETSAAYHVALQRTKTPSLIALSRSTLKGLAASSIEKASLGAYIALEPEGAPELIIVATGSEVGPSMEAATSLSDLKVRVVSMPCQELFLEQSSEYQLSVLPGNIPTLSVEASSIQGWHRFSHAQIGMHGFGASGNANHLMKHFGFTSDNIAKQGQALFDFYKKGGIPVPNLNHRPSIIPIANGH
jgi:transketolase